MAFYFKCKNYDEINKGWHLHLLLMEKKLSLLTIKNFKKRISQVIYVYKHPKQKNKSWLRIILQDCQRMPDSSLDLGKFSMYLNDNIKPIISIVYIVEPNMMSLSQHTTISSCPFLRAIVAIEISKISVRQRRVTTQGKNNPSHHSAWYF